MVLIDKLWDDITGGPTPTTGLGKLRKASAKPLTVKTGTYYSLLFLL